MSLPVAAILVAAGQSRRFGTDKLWIDIWGRPVWRWGLDALLAVPGMARVALVVPADGVERYTEALPPDAGERSWWSAAAPSAPIRWWPASRP